MAIYAPYIHTCIGVKNQDHGCVHHTYMHICIVHISRWSENICMLCTMHHGYTNQTHMHHMYTDQGQGSSSCLSSPASSSPLSTLCALSVVGQIQKGTVAGVASLWKIFYSSILPFQFFSISKAIYSFF